MKDIESMGHLEQRQGSWDGQQELMMRLYREGAEDFLDSSDNIKSAFETEKKCVCCMDEGTAHMDIAGKFEMAGSGILYPAVSWDERLDKVADLLLDLGIEEVTSHDGCGAAGLACKRDGIKTDNPDEYGVKWSQDLQKKMQEKAIGKQKVIYRHIKASEMIRPVGYHTARTVWFDGTGKFNPAALGEGAPHGFVIDYKNDTENAKSDDEKVYPYEELKVALSIAFGGHGFGKNFDERNKFVVVVMAEDQSLLDHLKSNVGEFINGLNIADETRRAIKIDGYLANVEKELEKAA